jgi:hypothetical protein
MDWRDWVGTLIGAAVQVWAMFTVCAGGLALLLWLFDSLQLVLDLLPRLGSFPNLLG